MSAHRGRITTERVGKGSLIVVGKTVNFREQHGRATPANMDANSIPMMAAPTTNRSRGASSRQCTSSESKVRFPSIGNIRAVRWTCATGNPDVMPPQKLRSFSSLDLDGVRVRETGVALKRRHLVSAKLRLDDFPLTRHHSLCPNNQIRHGNSIREAVTAAVNAALPEAARIEHSFTQGLAGDGSVEHTDAANRPLPVDDCDLFAQFGSADHRLLARWPTPDHYHVVFVRFHSFAPPGNSKDGTRLAEKASVGWAVTEKRSLLLV
jgi:hypothetical protein